MSASTKYGGFSERATWLSGEPAVKAVTAAYALTTIWAIDGVPREAWLDDVKVHLDTLAGVGDVVVSVWRDPAYVYVVVPDQQQPINRMTAASVVGGVAVKVDTWVAFDAVKSTAGTAEHERRTQKLYVAVRLSSGTANIVDIEVSGRY